ncbi:Type 1 glutamine amidotransferase-like domain-containing protein [Streptococcus marimammalium]|uniref:Type 1 glutamine amidotransferase-like domain-containing protein n=1 Tax=Streptococcus marimammalium TaxID=269666 RepID=UPI000362A4D4|nr:Type 1 glutamine amidotransferase-like domain-containing protein [Streptococcus marimammalium]
MKLFLCSAFEQVGSLLKNEVEGKNVVFIPTASINEEYKGYVDSARNLWKELKANIFELEISTASFDDIHKTFEKADIIYFTGGNTFFLIDQLKKTGVDELVKKELSNGKLYVGESAGAIICANELSYIKPMDAVPEDFSQKDYTGLNLIDFYVVPHYLCPPFTESSQKIIEENSKLNIEAITNSEAIMVENGQKTKMSL